MADIKEKLVELKRREKLVALIHRYAGGSVFAAETLADRLISNGVTIQE